MVADIFSQIKNGGMYIKILAINVAVFVIINLTSLILFLLNTNQGLNYEFINLLAAPSSFTSLIGKPWTILTYMFTHKDFFHLLLNSLMFVFAGKLFEETLGSFKLLVNYIAGGLLGVIIFVIAYQIFPAFNAVADSSIIIGASASILAILVIVTVYYPNMFINLLLIGQVKLKYVTIVFCIIDLLSIDKSNPGGHLSHIGGALWGYIYATQLQGGRDLLAWLKSFDTLTFKKSNLKVVSRNFKSNTSIPVTQQSKQKQMDELLDKISKKGYDSLTKEEKNILYKLSQDETLQK